MIWLANEQMSGMVYEVDDYAVVRGSIGCIECVDIGLYATLHQGGFVVEGPPEDPRLTAEAGTILECREVSREWAEQAIVEATCARVEIVSSTQSRHDRLWHELVRIEKRLAEIAIEFD